MTDREQQIRERAYAIWQEQGEADGLDEAHWRQAEEEIDAEGGQAKDVEAAAPALTPEAPQAGTENGIPAAPKKAKAKTPKPSPAGDGVHMGAIPGDPVVR